MKITYCNFCGFTNEDEDVYCMVKGPDVSICSSCIEICESIRREAAGNVEYASWLRTELPQHSPRTEAK